MSRLVLETPCEHGRMTCIEYIDEWGPDRQKVCPGGRREVLDPVRLVAMIRVRVGYETDNTLLWADVLAGLSEEEE